MQSALAASSLNAAAADASPLDATTIALLTSQCPQLRDGGSTSDLPSFDDLVLALGIPKERTEQLPNNARLPLRIVSKAADHLERSLWATWAANGVHELLSRELVAALADQVRQTVSIVELHGLAGRSDLNGQRAVVIGRLTNSGRVPVRVCSSGECVRVRPVNVFDGDALPCVLEMLARAPLSRRSLTMSRWPW